MKMQMMFRLLAFLFLAIWSAQTVAKGFNPVMETDDQRLVFAQLLGGHQEHGYAVFTPYQAHKPGILEHLTRGRLSFNWRSAEIPESNFGSQALYENRQTLQPHPIPAIKLDMSGSSIEFYRKGLHYQSNRTPVFFNLSYRNSDRLPKLIPDTKPDLTTTKGVTLDIGFTF